MGDANGMLVTRLGLGINERNVLAVNETEQSIADVPKHQTDGSVYMPVLIITRNSIDDGNDIIDAGNGDNKVLGGSGSDIITSTNGDDIIIGDNGSLDYTTSLLIQTTDASDATGAADSIDAGEGNNIILGGSGGDSINAGSNDDIIIGDHGEVL